MGTSNGRSYTICPASDFQVASYQITPGVASATACAQMCTADARCLRAVYSTTGSGDCHLKATSGTGNWSVGVPGAR